MAPLPVNSTYRVWVEYTSGDLAHDLLLRFDNSEIGPPGSEINSRLTAITNAMFACMADSDAVTGFRYANEGQDFSLPFGGPTGNGTQSGGTINPESRAGFYGAAARSVGGRMSHYNFFTIISYVEATYRKDYNELSANLQDFLDALRLPIDVETAPLVAIDGELMIFKEYLNIGQNAYWQRRQR